MTTQSKEKTLTKEIDDIKSGKNKFNSIYIVSSNDFNDELFFNQKTGKAYSLSDFITKTDEVCFIPDEFKTENYDEISIKKEILKSYFCVIDSEESIKEQISWYDYIGSGFEEISISNFMKENHDYDYAKFSNEHYERFHQDKEKYEKLGFSDDFVHDAPRIIMNYYKNFRSIDKTSFFIKHLEGFNCKDKSFDNRILNCHGEYVVFKTTTEKTLENRILFANEYLKLLKSGKNIQVERAIISDENVVFERRILEFSNHESMENETKISVKRIDNDLMFEETMFSKITNKETFK